MKTVIPLLLKNIAISLLFLSLFIIPFVLLGQRTEEFARSFLENDGNDKLAMLVAGALLAGDPVLPTPSSVVGTMLAAKTGFWPAALVNAFSLSLACVIGFALGRGGGAAMARVGRDFPPEFVDWVRRHGLVAVLLCRPVPVLAEASLILAGAAKHEPRRLLLWCSILQTCLGVTYAFVGSGWGQGSWDNVAIIVGSVGIPVLAAIIVAISISLTRKAKADIKQ
jgi:membrane protein DedA with SNARE-associated domain